MSATLVSSSPIQPSSPPIVRPRIDHPAAWTSAEVGGAEGLIHRISGAQQAALRRLAESLAGRPLASITREDASQPEIVTLMQAIRFEIMRGKGAVVLAGLDIAGLGEEDFERLFWALGTHLGVGVVQSARRDLVGRVEKREDNPAQRGYQLDIELGPHCDFHEVLALGCYRSADSGGESGMASSLAIHNAIAETRPDLLDALYQGFRHISASAQDLSENDVPIFCEIDGTVSAFYHRMFYVNAARELDIPLPPALVEGLALFDELAKSQAIRATFPLQPGEMMFWHNFINLHSRNSFVDRPEHRRLLFRLWLHTRPGEGRAMAPDFTARARIMDREHEQGRPGVAYQLDKMKLSDDS